MKENLIVAIDGPSGAGKSSLSKLLAEALGFSYIDTGAMYRAVALKAHEAGIEANDEIKLEEYCATTCITIENGDITLDGKNYSNKIRTSTVGLIASKYSVSKTVRDSLILLQRELGRNGRVVMEGRDIGTVVFPDADIKFYIDASPEVRAKRRYDELLASGVVAKYVEVLKEIKDRDARDSSRKHSPLMLADNAVYIDTSKLTKEEVVKVILTTTKERFLLGDNYC